MSKHLLGRLVLLAWLCAYLPAAAVAAPRVLVDIAPIGAIASRVMDGAGAPDALLPPGASPHQFSLAPSDARSLSEADLVFWVGPGLSAWMEAPLASLATGSEIIDLSGLPGLTVLPARAGGRFPEHDHDDHDQGDYGHDDDDHDHDHGAEAGSGDAGHAQSDEGTTDPHYWLDPRNAAVMADAMAIRLAGRDPANADLYRDNAEAFASEMAALESELRDALAAVRDMGFLVHHDGFQYFENRFGLSATGSVAGFAGDVGGVRRMSELRASIAADAVRCAFTEPQLPTEPLTLLAEGAGLRIATLDPIGVAGDSYATLLRNLADQALDCLSPG